MPRGSPFIHPTRFPCKAFCQPTRHAGERSHEVHFRRWALTISWIGCVVAEWPGATAAASLTTQPPPFPTALIALTTFSCRDLAQGGCGRFQPTNMPTHIQKRVAMILSDVVCSYELDKQYD